MTTGSYEAFYGLLERPFSLTPDPKFFYKSRAHGRAFDALTFGLRRRDSVLLLTGDFGLGKTTVCRTLIDQLSRRVPVAYLGNPLLAPADLLRLLLRDFGAVAADDMRTTVDSESQDLFDRFVEFVGSLQRALDGAVLIIDEAHEMPQAIGDELMRLTAVAVDGQKVMQVVLAAHPDDTGPRSPAIQQLNAVIATRARLLPFGREDCAEYVAHRLTIAGGSNVAFTSRAIDVLFGLSGGVPRLVNLLSERALQESAAMGSRKIEPVAIEAAAAALELLRTRPKRFRWFQKRVS